MLEVAVIGAGASALAASRHLLGSGLRPIIFEAAKTLGGAWNTQTDQSKMWNGMTTNLSKHTCRFSEWPWPEDTPTFPTSVDMNQYLESYAEHFLDPTCFQYQCQVTRIEPLGKEAASQNTGYRVEWTDLAASTMHSKDFEGVVVATGFFSRPHLPSDLLHLHLDTNPEKQQRILHSSDYKSSAGFVNQTVAVVGSSFSALEIAVDVSTTAKRVLNVVSQVPWVVPRYLPHPSETASSSEDKHVDDPFSTYASTSTSRSILPVDLAFYRRTQNAPQLPERTNMKPEMARVRHDYLHSIVGRRQEQTPLGIPVDWEKPPTVAISDYYLDLVMQGDIEVVHGRLDGPLPSSSSKSPREDGASNTTTSVSSTDSWQVKTPSGQSMSLTHIDRVIYCTGYESDLHHYLHPDILETLEYDATNQFCPMTACWDTLHPQLPNFFFCGMYRGPYMGVMELQGRLAAGVLCGEVNLEEATVKHALETSRKIRSQTPAAQFPHFDYVGYMDTLADILPNHDFPKTNTQKGDMISPAFYQTNVALAEQEAKALEYQVERGLDGSRIPALVLSAILGYWNFDRRIEHFQQENNNDRNQEHVYGTVRYTRPTLDYVLYREDGFYELSPAKTLNVFREYEYQVAGDCLELYFVESGQRTHLFLSLKFSKQEGDCNYWVATSDHLCIHDLYKANFQVRLDGMAATELQIAYRVKGPAKDYKSTTILTPKQVQQVQQRSW